MLQRIVFVGGKDRYMFTFIHLSDLHFGKTLHDVALVQEDQPFWVERFIEAMDEVNPDAVVIAGDVYETRNPDQESILLFDYFLTELAKRGKYVFIVPGNHDSHVRLSVGAKLYEDKKIYIARNLEKEIMHITTTGDTPVTFWLLPYVFRKTVASLLEDESIDTYDAALKAIIDLQKVDHSHPNVLVAHQNVIASAEDKPEASGSESVIIGGVGEVLASRFDEFDYVALGHIHKEQKIGRETIRYSGCPMYYDFSEVNRKKALTIVTIADDGSISYTYKDIYLPYYLYQAEGTFEELKKQGPAWVASVKAENEELRSAGCPYEKRYYVKLVVKGGIPAGGQDVLKHVYGRNVLNIDPVSSNNNTGGSPKVSSAVKDLDLATQFEQMYQQMDKGGRELSDVQRRILDIVLESQEADGEYYIEKSLGKEIGNGLLEEILKVVNHKS